MIYFIFFVLIERFFINKQMLKYIYKIHNEFTDMPSSLGMVSFEVGEFLFDELGISNVVFSYDDNLMSDRYNWKQRIIYLSSTVYYAKTLSGLAVVVHEVSHAYFHKLINKIIFLGYITGLLFVLFFLKPLYNNPIFIFIFIDIGLRMINFINEVAAYIISKRFIKKYKLDITPNKKELNRLLFLPIIGAIYSFSIVLIPLFIWYVSSFYI